MEDYTDKEFYKTYDEWQELGYHVVRGQKFQGRNELGIPVFHEEQVEENEFSPYEYGFDIY